MLTIKALLSFVLLVLVSKANADMDTCVDDFIILSEDESFQESTTLMINTFVETCENTGLCPYTVDETLLADAESVAANPSPETLSDVPPIEGNLEIFSAGFATDQTYIDYTNSCILARGEVRCVDATLLADGIITPLDDLPVDVSVLVHAFPMCLPPSCADEDLTKLTETVIKETIKNDPEISEALASNGIAVSTIDFFTIDLICGLSELDVCTFEVEEVACGSSKVTVGSSPSGASDPVASSSSFKASGSFAATLISVAGGMAAMM